jgi:hypothetical protein
MKINHRNDFYVEGHAIAAAARNKDPAAIGESSLTRRRIAGG